MCGIPQHLLWELSLKRARTFRIQPPSPNTKRRHPALGVWDLALQDSHLVQLAMRSVRCSLPSLVLHSTLCVLIRRCWAFLALQVVFLVLLTFASCKALSPNKEWSPVEKANPPELEELLQIWSPNCVEELSPQPSAFHSPYHNL